MARGICLPIGPDRYACGRGVSERGAGLTSGLGRVPAPPTRVLVLGIPGRCVPLPSGRARMASSLGSLPGSVCRVFTSATS